MSPFPDIAALDRARVPEDLTTAARALDQWIHGQLERIDTKDCSPVLESILDQVSRFNQALISRVIRHRIARLQSKEGLTPPQPFCWISMGSDARGEQVIRTDQDNALIYADPLPGEEAAAADYFNRLARGVTRDLDTLGFSLCKGDVMASNPQWCRSLSKWLLALEDWVGASDPMAVRNLTILLDFKAVFGDPRLAAMLQKNVFHAFEHHPQASHFLVRDDQLFAPPKKSFNRIRTQRKHGCRACFNLKTQAIAHIVNAARLFAVNHKIRVPSTLGRLSYLNAEKVISEEEFKEITNAFLFLTGLKIRSGLDRESGIPANHIDIAGLEKNLKQELHKALDQVAAFQKKAADTYNQAWMNFFN